MGARGAVLTAAAPEAAAARKVAGGRPKAADPRVSAPGSNAAKQRTEIEAIKAGRKPDPVAPTPTPTPSPATSPPPASPGGGPSLPSVPLPAAASTGSGFLLGVFVWALGLAYLQHGSDGVKQFLSAKFLNKA